MMNGSALLPYYHGILMGIDTVKAYQSQARSPKQQEAYERVLQKFEVFKLQITHEIEADAAPPAERLPWYQQISRFFTVTKIRRIADSATLWRQSQHDYQLGLEMMEKFLAKHQRLSDHRQGLIIEQIGQTQALGIQLNLLNG